MAKTGVINLDVVMAVTVRMEADIASMIPEQAWDVIAIVIVSCGYVYGMVNPHWHTLYVPARKTRMAEDVVTVKNKKHCRGQ